MRLRDAIRHILLGGIIAADTVAKSQPDGYTLLMGGSATHVFAPSLQPDLPYDPVKGFAPITEISSGPLILVVNPGVPAKTIAEFMAYLRTEGSRVNFASNGAGTFPHLAGELFKQAAGVKAVHVPYTGGPKAILALLSNEVAFSINHIPNVVSLVKAGKLRALATTGSHRSPTYPELPTFQEAGIRDFEANAWFGLFAPAGTPRPIIDLLQSKSAEALQAKDFRDRLAAQGDEPVGSTPDAFARYMNSEIAKWRTIIKDAAIKIN
jgi:tripartite-type tricarboxylate transporter receptor subunit TctC